MKTKTFTLFFLLLLATAPSFAQGQQMGTKEALAFAENWNNTPGTDNDKELAMLKPGTQIFIKTETLQGKVTRNKWGTVCIESFKRHLFIQYNENKNRFEIQTDKPVYTGLEGDFVFLCWALLLFMVSLCGMISIYDRWKSKKKLHFWWIISLFPIGVFACWFNQYIIYLEVLAIITLIVQMIRITRAEKKQAKQKREEKNIYGL